MATKGRGNVLNIKPTKCERKALRKQARKFFSFKNDKNGLQISEIPTKHLVIGNGGLICGMERSSLLQLFSKFGHVESLYMIPGKQYSLLSFQTELEAMEARNNINGRSLVYPDEVPKTGITLYLAYLMDKLDTSSLMKWNIQPVLPSQTDLFPPGLILKECFISRTQEQELIDYFTIQNDIDSNKSMKHRKVNHYGYEFIYGKNNVDVNKPLDEGIPSVCKPIIDKMLDDGVITWQPDQLTVNQYETGQGIPTHTDTHSAFEDGIISLSLGSQVVMEFCHPNGKQIPLILPSCSLLVMKGESRYLWTHGITPRKTDIVIDTQNEQDEKAMANSGEDNSGWLTLKERGFRISLTFRKILRTKCCCKYPEKCDSQGFKRETKDKDDINKTIFVPKDDLEARKLEADHVYNVYDEIADHFSDTRHSPWPKVAAFLMDLSPYSLVADVGCGNGKYLGVNKDILAFGSDRSVNLIKICRERGHCAIVSDILSLPYRSCSFDAAISIAVIHHLSTKERRASAIKEILRIVKPKGLVLIYVWAQEQDKDPACCGPKDSGKEGSICFEGDSEEVELLNNDGGSVKSSSNDATRRNSSGVMNDEHQSTITEEETREKIAVNEVRNVFQQQDLLVPWHFRGSAKKGKACFGSSEKERNGEHIYHRFYHVFLEGELEELCSNLDSVKIVNSYHDRGNWCIILKKT